jgi:copper oxidase (laccase) domain-containing protein
LRADFVTRVPELEMDCERDEAMRRLREVHTRAVAALGFSPSQWWRAEQIHGAEVAVVGKCPTILASDDLPVIPGVDGLICGEAGHVLAIYVADCGAIWLADRATGAYGLLHSGKVGTEKNILQVALDAMQKNFGSQAKDIVGVLGPCIRPPHYEINFAAAIRSQAEQAGVSDFFDCGICTGSDLQAFYSYRKERGRTGRLMALIGRPLPL